HRPLAVALLVLDDCNLPGALVKFSFWSDLLHALKLCSGCAGDADIVLVLIHGLDNARDVLDGFAAVENHFRKALPQTPMVVDIRESQVLERQSPQPMQGVL